MPAPGTADEERSDRRSIDIWAGVECSVVRIEDRIVDELSLTGHARRPADLRRLAELGVHGVRYPALWERHPDPARGRFRWAATDRRMATIRSLGLRPILGLFHQGTGRHGELLDPGFPEAFGRYAGEVARRYPWVDAYLPVNEPLTTARFAGLYGHWYPHARDDGAFARMVVAGVLAFRAAARAIRAVRPDAVILATEDAGETFSTPELEAQAWFDSQRRWLALDMLTGRFGRTHPLRAWLERAGLPAVTLDVLGDVDAVERPNLLGVHYYPTSDRFLDHRLHRYPAWAHGGNGAMAYADVEAIRVVHGLGDGLREALLAASRRYGLPLALTEVHLGGSPEDQRAWWCGAVSTADDLVKRGVDVRAVTAWSAFGSWEWTSLLREDRGHYEPGLFDTRERPPRPMALAADVAVAARGDRLDPEYPGWWRLPSRLVYPPVDRMGRDVAPGEVPATTALPPAIPATRPPGRRRASRARAADEVTATS